MEGKLQLQLAKAKAGFFLHYSESSSNKLNTREHLPISSQIKETTSFEMSIDSENNESMARVGRLIPELKSPWVLYPVHLKERIGST